MAVKPYPSAESLRVYHGKWVAIDNGVVIAHADNLKQLLADLTCLPASHRPLVHLVPGPLTIAK